MKILSSLREDPSGHSRIMVVHFAIQSMGHLNVQFSYLFVLTSDTKRQFRVYVMGLIAAELFHCHRSLAFRPGYSVWGHYSAFDHPLPETQRPPYHYFGVR